MKNRYLILGVIVVFVIILIILLTRKNKELNTFTFPKELIVINHTKHHAIDTMSMIVLNKIMKIDTIEIHIYNINDNLFKMKDMPDIEILGYIEKNSYKKHYYFLYINKNIDENAIKRVISHEMIHVLQMENGDLIQSIFFKNFSIYKHDTIYYNLIPYNLRPFEIDAFAVESKVSDKLYKLLYK